MLVDSLKLEMPESFPAGAYRAFMDSARAVLLNPKGVEWAEFAGASNLIGWRFRSFEEDRDAYLDSWNRDGVHTSFEELYRRERWLFGMFSSAVSCIESTSYAIYAFASHAAVLGLPFGPKEQFGANLAGLRAAVTAADATHPLAAVLDGFLADPSWRMWTQLRNRMTHRGNLPRLIKGSIGGSAPPGFTLEFAATSSSPAVQVDEAGFDALTAWLPANLKVLLQAGTVLK